VSARVRRAAVALLALACLGMKVPPPQDYGRVVLDNFSRKAGMDPVRFDHFTHRSRFTCRLCHVDVGFAMAVGATKVSAATNESGFHCGACHDGKRVIGGKAVFASCTAIKPASGTGTCERCHHRDDAVARREAYYAFAADLPRARVGGGVDWEVAEASGQIRPADHVEGLTLPRRRLEMDRDVALDSRGSWMSNVVFSHKKHAVWNGCEVCHPEIFPQTQRDAMKFTMIEIGNGLYCGVCHDKVAFPLADCDRCHTESMTGPRSRRVR